MPSTYAQRKASKARKLAAEKQESQTPAVDPDFPEEMGPVTSDDPALTTMPVRRKDEDLTPQESKALSKAIDHVSNQRKVNPAWQLADASSRATTMATTSVAETPAATVGPPVPPLDPAALFAAWLASPQGLDCTDPRCPSDPLRKRADLETRLKLAFVAGMAMTVVGAVGV